MWHRMSTMLSVCQTQLIMGNYVIVPACPRCASGTNTVSYRSGVTRQHLEPTTASINTQDEIPVTWRDGFGWALLVMYWVRFLAVFFLSIEGHSAWRYALYPNHLPENDGASWIKRREQRPPGTGISSAEQYRRRSVRRRRTVHTLRMATNFTFTSDFVTSTLTRNAANSFVTHTVTTPLN